MGMMGHSSWGQTEALLLLLRGQGYTCDRKRRRRSKMCVLCSLSILSCWADITEGGRSGLAHIRSSVNGIKN